MNTIPSVSEPEPEYTVKKETRNPAGEYIFGHRVDGLVSPGHTSHNLSVQHIPKLATGAVSTCCEMLNRRS